MLHKKEVIFGINKIFDSERIREQYPDPESLNETDLCFLFERLTGSPIKFIGEDKFKISDL